MALSQAFVFYLLTLLGLSCTGFVVPSLTTSQKINELWRTERFTLHAQGYDRRQSFDRHDNRKNENADNGDPSIYVATCIPGLADILAQELTDLGSPYVETTGNAAVRFEADLSTVLNILIWARTPHKIMELLSESPPSLESRDDLYEYVRSTIPVKEVLGDGKGGLLTMSVSTILNNPSKIPKDINHSHYTALTIKNALCDAVRDSRGDRPDVDTTNPDLPLVAVLRGLTGSGAQLSLYRQIHQGSLHRRGYRAFDSAIHKAAMKESLASGLLLSAKWPQTCKNGRRSRTPIVFVDPMAGSGTLLLEGLFMAANVAPHVLRLKCGLQPVLAQQYPPITRWKHHIDIAPLWKDLLVDASASAKKGLNYLRGQDDDRPITFIANDFHPGALDLLHGSLSNAGVDSLVELQETDCRDLAPTSIPPNAAWNIFCNPPWGVRLTEDISESWESLRFFLRETCPEGTTAHVLSGNAEATRHLGLRRSSSLPVKVGQVQMRWLEYKMEKPKSRDFQDGEGKPKHRQDGRKKQKKAVFRSTTVAVEDNEWIL